jgi:cobalt transporter subunit CbtA
MIKRVLLSALAAGALAAVFITAVQSFTTIPIIHHAEKFEKSAKGDHHSGVAPLKIIRIASVVPPNRIIELAHGDGKKASKNKAWSPADGWERILFTGLSNLVAAIGFALLLVGCFVIHGRPVSAARGFLWGMGGFAVFVLAPGLGLPPEIPGSKAADLIPRQTWWVAAAAAAALGLWLMIFTRHTLLKAAGVLVIALPHLIGAPQPATLGGSAPPELAGHFAAASIVVNAIFWASLGWLAGAFYERLADWENDTGQENAASG